eukprot:Hpha_TRINITY_DN22065_c0_g1::TRINITY_DN22065_c0_g1_i1::g.112203::m.112203
MPHSPRQERPSRSSNPSGSPRMERVSRTSFVSGRSGRRASNSGNTDGSPFTPRGFCRENSNSPNSEATGEGPGGRSVETKSLALSTATTSAKKGTESSNVQVMVRVRPFSKEEVEQVKKMGSYMQSVIDMPRNDQVLLLDPNRDYEEKQAFSFDRVFWSLPAKQQKSPVGFACQQDVYLKTGAIALESAWDGFNSCVFAYGQTGSGKTHTMMGDPAFKSLKGEDDARGVIPRLCESLFAQTVTRAKIAREAGVQKEFVIQVLFVEIYNEKVKDLLSSCQLCPNFVRTLRGENRADWSRGAHSPAGSNRTREGSAFEDEELPPGMRYKARQSGAAAKFTAETHPQHDPLDIAPKPQPDLKVRDHPTEGPILDGCTIHEPSDYSEIMSLINHGLGERHTAHTKMNDRSSRSHAIFRISVRQMSYFDKKQVGISGPGQQSSERRANINLVDLAGSENLKRSGASGTTALEARNINVSLTKLRMVIDALIDTRPRNVIPYRESTLTWLLKNDLGGNSKCIMLATVSPRQENLLETFNTLKYAMRARSIVNKVRVNEDDTAALLEEIEKKIRAAHMEMDRQGISSEYREKMLEELQAANSAKAELQRRLEDIEAATARNQLELASLRRKRVEAHMRGCAAMQLAKEIEAASAQGDQSQTGEVAKVEEKLKELGHADLDSLTQAVRSAKTRETELHLERDRLEKKIEESRQRGEAKLRERARETQKEQSLHHERKEETRRALQELEEQHQQLVEKVRSLEDTQRAKKVDTVRMHKDRIGQLAVELKEVVTNFEAKKEGFHRSLADEEDKCKRQIREHEIVADSRIRVLQEHEVRLREELVNGKYHAEQSQKQHEELLRLHETTKAELDKQHTTEILELHQVHSGHMGKLEGERAELQRMLVDAEKALDRLAQERIDMQRRFRDVAEKESRHRRAFQEVTDLFDFLGTETLPDSWGIAEVRSQFAEFRRRQRQYSSHRPSREQLRQMLNDDPQRVGADRMRVLLAETSQPGSEACSVLLDGLRCPDLPRTAGVRSPSADRANGAKSPPYGAVPPPPLPVSLSRQVTPALPPRGTWASESPALGPRHSTSSVRSSSRHRSSPSKGPRRRPVSTSTNPSASMRSSTTSMGGNTRGRRVG